MRRKNLLDDQLNRFMECERDQRSKQTNRNQELPGEVEIRYGFSCKKPSQNKVIQ